jgi:hypothetical protein
MNITIRSDIDGNTMSNDYRNMNAKLIVEAINNLLIDGHKIVSITDIDGDNN